MPKMKGWLHQQSLAALFSLLQLTNSWRSSAELTTK